MQEACACIQVGESLDLGWACQRIESAVVDSSAAPEQGAAGVVGTAFKQSRDAAVGAPDTRAGARQPESAALELQQVGASQTGEQRGSTEVGRLQKLAADAGKEQARAAGNPVGGSGAGPVIDDEAVVDQGFRTVENGALGSASSSISNLPRKLLLQRA